MDGPAELDHKEKQQPATTDPRILTPGLGPVGLAAILLGASAALTIVGLDARFRALFDKHVTSNIDQTPAVVGVTLIALSIGVRVPQRIALWVCGIAWRRFISRGQTSQVSDLLLDPGRADRSLYWIALSIISLTAGIFVATLPFTLRLAENFYAVMMAHFLWSRAPLAILQACTVFFASLLPMPIIGLALSCVHHLSCPSGRWETRATGWTLLGAAGGLVAAHQILDHTGHGDLILFAAALPALLIALVSVGPCATPSSNQTHNRHTMLDALPASVDHWPRLLRACVVAVGGLGACAVALWIEYFNDGNGPAENALALTVFGVGIGVLLGCKVRGDAVPSIGGFGVACTIAGLAVAAASMGLCELHRLISYKTATWILGGAGAVGFAMAYGRRTLINRVADRSFAGATTLARILILSGLAIWIAAPLTLRFLGRSAAPMALAVALLAMGGTLIIHEPGYPRPTRRIRLGAVFACLGLMIAWFISPLRDRHSTHHNDPLPSQTRSRHDSESSKPNWQYAHRADRP